MEHPKRLFLFAGYTKDTSIDDSLIYHVAALSKYGDVILFLDNDLKKSELNKVKQYTIFANAKRHGEYDFGSYKRCYQYARDKKLLNKYDYVYLVNDSVFGPMFDMTNTIKNIEAKSTDAVGMIISKHKTHKFMESWFVKLNKNVFMTDWFDEFISSVQLQPTKAKITIRYEHGLTNLIQNHNCSWGGLYTYRGRYTYNNPLGLFKHGCPFVKKASFTRHNGDCGKQIKYILNHANFGAALSTIVSANRVYGENYMNWLLTGNPIKILMRKIKYIIQKIKNG